MLRRLTCAVRTLLLVIGVLLLAWVPISFYICNYIVVEWHSIDVRNGVIFATEILQREMEQEQFPLLRMKAGPGDEALEASSSSSSLAPRQPPPAPRPLWYYWRWNVWKVANVGPGRPPFAMLPSYKRVPYTYQLIIPLWLPAMVCLTWPTASFIARRRKRARGFPVQTTNA